MTLTVRLTLILSMLLLSSCSFLAAEEAVEVSITQTLGAQLAETGVAAAEATNTAEFERLNTVIETQNAQLTQGAATATEAPLATSTAVAAATNTAASAPDTSVSVQIVAQTACRTGTSTVFETVRVFDVGETIEPVSRNEAGTWYEAALENGVSCWFFNGENLSTTGLPSTLPIADAPSVPTATIGPTEAPGFYFGGRLIYSCGGKEYISFAVQSRGGLTFRSGRIALYNKTTATDLGADSGNLFFFGTADSCANQGAEALIPGETAYIHMELKNTTVDDELQVNVRLCTEKVLGGECFNSALMTHK